MKLIAVLAVVIVIFGLLGSIGPRDNPEVQDISLTQGGEQIRNGEQTRDGVTDEAERPLTSDEVPPAQPEASSNEERGKQETQALSEPEPESESEALACPEKEAVKEESAPPETAVQAKTQPTQEGLCLPTPSSPCFLFGHKKEVSAVAFSPDGRFLASGSYDKTIKLWELPDGQEVYTLAGHTNTVDLVAFSPDGKLLASAFCEKQRGYICPQITIKLWETATGKELHRFQGHGYKTATITFSPDSQLLASASCEEISWVSIDWSHCSKSELKLWNVTTGQEIHTFIGHSSEIVAIGFTPEGDVLISITQDGVVRLWATKEGRLLKSLKLHPYPLGTIRTAAFNADATLLVSLAHWGGMTDRIELWRVETGEKLRDVDKEDGKIFSSVAFSPDSKLLITGAYDKIYLWEVASGRFLRTLSVPPGLYGNYICPAAFSPDGKLVAGRSGKAVIVQLAVGWGERTFERLTFGPTAIVFSPDGKLLAAASCGKRRAPRCVQGELKLWDVTKGEEVDTLEAHEAEVTALAFSPDGQLLASAAEWPDKTIKLWDATTGQNTQTLTGHSHPVVVLTFRSDGDLLASGSQLGRIKLWDVSELGPE